MVHSVIISTGSYLPEKVVSNQALEQTLDTSDAWIRERTGITQRHIAADGELTSDMALQASKAALSRAGLEASDLDLVIVATTTPDRTFPATAVILQQKLGMNGGAGFDLQAVCSGFVYGISTADAMIRSGAARRVLVVGADRMSSIVDWTDRNTCVLFGDGAGAVILEASEDAQRGVLGSVIYSDGNLESILHTDGGVGVNQCAGTVQMNGKEVFRHAVDKMTSSVQQLLQTHQIAEDEIRFFVPHQANARILSSVAKKLKLPASTVISSVERHANTSAASIPLALDELCQREAPQEGDVVVFTAVGGGLTWGSVLLRW